MKLKIKAPVSIGLGLITLFALLYQNFTLFNSDHYLSAFPNVCLAGTQRSCAVEIEWNAGTGKSACLFRESDRSLLGCASKKRLSLSTSVSGDVFQLRRDSSFSSPLLNEIQVVAIQVEDRVLKQNLTNENRLTLPLVKGITHFQASTWDGKLFFNTREVILSGGRERQYYDVRALRPSEFANRSVSQVNFRHAHSAPFLLTIDRLKPGEYPEVMASIRSEPGLGGLENITESGGNTVSKPPFTIAPDPDFHVNPYRSDRSGNPNAGGKFRTYRFQVISAPRAIIRNNGSSLVTGRYRQFLAHAQGYVIVANPNTDPKVIEGEIGDFTEIRDEDGEFFAGHEPTVTLDGRLLIWDGQPTIERDGRAYSLTGFNNMLMYSYRKDPAKFSGWSKPRPVTDMYYVDGPGKGGAETKIDGIKFSHHYPIAKYPIVDDLGIPFGKGQVLSGSYPWISLDGSDLIYSSVFTPTGNQRTGKVMIGVRTRGKIRYIDDGGMNVLRGVSPVEDPLLYRDENQDLIRRINLSYSKLKFPIFDNQAIGRSTNLSSVVIHLVEFPSSWDGLREVANPGLPFSFTDEAYGFFVSPTGRYAEVPLPSLAEDLLLWIPMNESIRYSRSAADEYIKNPSPETRQIVTGFRTKTAPDMSIYHQRGALNSNAHFPYEYHDVPGQWAQNRTIVDRYEGAQGNSVVLAQGGQVSVTLSQEALRVFNDMKRYHLGFWIRPHSLGPTPLFSWNRVINVALDGSRKLVFTHSLKIPPGSREIRQSVPYPAAANVWTHVLVSRDLDRITVYINGRSQSSMTVKENSFPNWQTFPHNQVALGPSAMARLDVDELVIGTGFLTEQRILQLARVKANFQEWPGVANQLVKGPYFASKGLMARIPQNNPFSMSAAGVGELLFNEKTLSSNNAVSCASCHNKSLSFADSKPFSMGVSGATTRNSPALVNLAFADSFFWDGSSKTLESQVLHPFIHPEMGLSVQQLVTRVQAAGTIKDRLVATYGGPVTATSIAKALASYVRSLTTPSFKFDPESLNPIEQDGWAIFNGRGNCVACHSGALFTDGKLHDIGLKATIVPNGMEDLGAFYPRKDLKESFAMKTPSLINVRQTAPYFHDGRASTIEDVIEFYDRGGDEETISRKSRSPFLRPLGLTSADKTALAAFLRSLSAPVNP